MSIPAIRSERDIVADTYEGEQNVLAAFDCLVRALGRLPAALGSERSRLADTYVEHLVCEFLALVPYFKNQLLLMISWRDTAFIGETREIVRLSGIAPQYIEDPQSLVDFLLGEDLVFISLSEADDAYEDDRPTDLEIILNGLGDDFPRGPRYELRPAAPHRSSPKKLSSAERKKKKAKRKARKKSRRKKK